MDVNSDGNVNLLIPALLDAGVNCLPPMDPAAGMDLVTLRQQHGARVAFCGGLGKSGLHSRERIVAELERKIPPKGATGGCVFGLDHRVPDGTPLGSYCFRIQKVWKILDLEGVRRIAGRGIAL